MNERQEIWCHNCNHYVQFDIDMELDGNHVLLCPNCQHEHCRVVKNGVITDDRWDSRNATYYVSIASAATSTTSVTISLVSASTTSGTGALYLASSWMSTTCS